MSQLLIKRWSDENPDSDFTEEAIRQLHQPAGHFRITVSKYPPETHFSGISRERISYILQGTGQIEIEGVSRVFDKGDIIKISGGDYRIQVFGEQELQIVNVWYLPSEFHT